MQLYLVRHPPPSGIDGLCYGRLDVRVGARAAARAAEAIFAQIPGQTLASARVYCSPSSRCLELARRIAAPREPIPAEDLMEMSFGHWEGVAWDAIPRPQIDAWANDVWGYRPGDGESARMVEARWTRWLHEVRRNETGGVIAVTHAGVIRVALACAGQLNRSLVIRAPIPFGSVHHLDIGGLTVDQPPAAAAEI